MAVDPTIFERNRAATRRMRALAERLSDAELLTPVGEHWTVGVVYAHLAFWDRRVLYVLDKTAQDGKVYGPFIDVYLNDLSLPLWLAIPPREAARIALETADTLDQRLETYPPALLEQIYAFNKRWVDRSLHRGEHIGEAEQSVK
jgi:hypothetical protein